MTSNDAPDQRPSNEPGKNAGVHLFPSCDPRGVVTRALATDAPAWSTRPDALIFGWMLALPTGIESRAAANAVLACVAADKRDTWTDAQRELLVALTDVAEGRQKHPIQRRRGRR